jgi:hypothetical protein
MLNGRLTGFQLFVNTFDNPKLPDSMAATAWHISPTKGLEFSIMKARKPNDLDLCLPHVILFVKAAQMALVPLAD